MKRSLTSLLGAMLLCAANTSAAVFFEPQIRQHWVPDRDVSFQVESGAPATIDTMIAKQDGWETRARRDFEAGGPAMTVWARFDLPEATAPHRVLVNASPWERVDYYFVSGARVIATAHAGSLLPRSARSEPAPMISPMSQSGFVSVDVPAHARYTVFARLSSSARYVAAPGLHFALWDPEDLQRQERSDRDIQGIFFGMLLLLFVCNFALFLFNPREQSFLYYALSLAGFFGLWGAYTGLTFEFLWPEHPQWDYLSVWLSLPLAQASFIQFMRHLLDTRRLFPKMDFALKWVLAAALAMIPFALLAVALGNPLRPDTPTELSGAVALAAFPVFLYVTLKAAARRVTSARILLSAWVLGFIGALVPPLIESGVLPSGPWTWNLPQFGAALTGIMLSIWLGVRLQHATSELVARKLEEERVRNIHEREKREMLDRERSRIMSDMHDGVGGQLISVLSLLEHGGVPNTEVAKAIRECLDDLRLTIDSLEPTDNDLLPVLGNLRYRLDQRLKKHGIELDWEVNDVPKLACLTPRNVLHILRILQEAFTNVLKHARATKVGVETGLDAPGNHVYIRVSDNGAGFTGERAGHGLANMRRRAGIIGGSLDIQASPAGTTLNLLLPVS